MEGFYHRNNKIELSTQEPRDLDNDGVTVAGEAGSGTHLPALLLAARLTTSLRHVTRASALPPEAVVAARMLCCRGGALRRGLEA